MAAAEEEEIVWPDCLTVVGVQKPTGLFSFFSSEQLMIFSVSGGQLQYSVHPALAGKEITNNELEVTSHEWKLKDLTTLDGFAYDPRNPGCTGHASVKGGVLEAKFQMHI